MTNIPQWAFIFISCFMIILTIVVSLSLYILIKNKYIIKISEMYNEKVEFLFKLPFNSKLKKLEKYKVNNSQHNESFEILKKQYDDFTNINVNNFLKRLDKLKKSTIIFKKGKENSGNLFKFPQEQISEIDESFLNLMKKGIEIFEELDRITYFDELQKNIIGNVQESLTFFRQSYLSNRDKLLKFSKDFDKWLSEIDIQFQKYNNSITEGTSNAKNTKDNITEIIISINKFSISVRHFLEGVVIINKVIDPEVLRITEMTKINRSVVLKNKIEFEPYANKYQGELKLFTNLNIKETSFVINGTINNMLTSFLKFSTLFYRQIKTKELINELQKSITNFQNEITQKQDELYEEALKIQKNKAKDLKKYFLNLRDQKKKLNLSFNDIERLFKRKNEDSFKIFFRIFNEEKKYYSLVEKYAEIFSEIIEFISSNLKSYSRFEKNINTYNSLLVNIEINIKNHNIKLSENIKRTLSKEKSAFNNLIYNRDNNQLLLSEDIEERINISIKKLDEFDEYISRWNKIATILELTFVYLNRFKGEDEQMDKKIDLIRNEFEAGEYRESLKKISEVFKTYDLRG